MNREQELPEVPRSWEYRVPTDYMVGFIPDLTYENVMQWIAPENLVACERREFEGFTLWASIDGNLIPGREVTLGHIEGPSDEGQHVHESSDAFIIVTAGVATLLMGPIISYVSAPKLIRVPKGTPHGFRLNEWDIFEFVSVQYPPIRDPETGVEDFRKAGP